MRKDLSLPHDAPGARRSHLAAPAVLLFAFLLLAGYYLPLPGLAWDESLYIPYAETYRRWVTGLPETFTWQQFYDSLGRFTSHPPLAKYTMAVTTQLFGDSMSRLYAARVASVASTGALLGAVYFFGVYARGRLAAVAAAATLLLMPRFFAHSLLATLEAPMALWWFVAAATFYIAMEHRRWAWVAGLAAGLALLTKVNGLMLPLVLWPWGLFFYRRRALPAILWTLVLAPPLFFALWPFLWPEPVVGMGKYLGEKFAPVVSIYAWFGVDLHTAGDAIHRMMKRTVVPVWYFGRAYEAAPWHYPFVMTAITTPLAALAAALWGAVRCARERREASLRAFLLWNIFFWLGSFAIGLSRPYDGVRLFLVIFPFVALLAGFNIAEAWKALSSTRARAWAPAALVAAYVALLAVPFARYQPFGLSYYNALVGGLPGAAEKGFQVSYWGEAIDEGIFEYVNSHAPEGARVAAYPMERLYVENMRFFGLLRGDILDVTTAGDWDYLLVANRQDLLSARPDIAELTAGAVVTREVRGVPAAWLVERQ